MGCWRPPESPADGDGGDAVSVECAVCGAHCAVCDVRRAGGVPAEFKVELRILLFFVFLFSFYQRIQMEDATPLTGMTFIKGEPVALERGKIFVLEFWATW